MAPKPTLARSKGAGSGATSLGALKASFETFGGEIGPHRRASALDGFCSRAQQQFHVLHRRDQPVLDLLPPQAPPARALEPVFAGRAAKTPFHQMLPPPPITPRRGAACDLPPQFHLRRLFVPLHGPFLSRSTLLSQRTSRAHARRGGVFMRAPPLMITPPRQRLPGRTTIDVARRIVSELAQVKTPGARAVTLGLVS